MPTFDTPEPILVSLELGVGDIRIAASERTDTTVEVSPSDPAQKSDVTAAAETRVEFTGGRLLVRAAKGWRLWTLRGGGESVDVRIGLPAGSELRGDAGVAGLRCTGPLGECRFKTGIGEIRIEQAGPVQLKTGGGDISIDRAVSHAEVTTRTGTIRVGSIDGTGVIRNSNGDTWVGTAGGDLRVSAANGRIDVVRADAGVTAKTANGDVGVGEVANGAILAETARGTIAVGVRDGIAAWLDLDTRCGNVENRLDAAERPAAGEDAVEVRARSAFGDITVRRAAEPSTAERPTVSRARPAHRS
jgi:hypothetical protein